jgi:dinuclear metal center YbgI/SA1388 family protein
MEQLDQVLLFLQEVAPLQLAHSWDNVGLLVGSRCRSIRSVMTCLTVTDAVVDEAISRQVDLIVAHHPIPFRPIPRLTDENQTGSLLLKLCENRIAVYSPHTAWDNAQQGINQQLAEILELEQVEPLLIDGKVIAGRVGQIATRRSSLGQANTASLDDVISRLKGRLPGSLIKTNRSASTPVTRVAIVCGSGGSFVRMAYEAQADVLVTGEATYHQVLEASHYEMAILEIGHFSSERFAMAILGRMLGDKFPELQVFTSEFETDAYVPIDER